MLGLGFVLGLRHATEADHLVAVTAIVSEQRSIWRSSLIGALWGVGHTVALLAAGVVVILARVAIPERVAGVLEFAPALMIILLGARILWLLLRDRRRVQVHNRIRGVGAGICLDVQHERSDHQAMTASGNGRAWHKGPHDWRPMVVGMVHGLAGSAALTLLVLTEVMNGGSRALGLSYLLIFGIGSIGGMLMMSTLVSLPFVFTSARATRIDAPVRLISGVASVAFGLVYLWTTARAAYVM
jgi:ABC-type nickel/cobalt efflux system permease component RcnA